MVGKQILTTIEKYHLLMPGDTVVAGVSGGPDSLCMLHVLRGLKTAWQLTLIVAHLHHGLRGADADADAGFVQATARGWGLSCVVERCDVQALADEQGLALEEAARLARYRFLGHLAQTEAAHAIAVAHNADDQSETVLMHWMRGAGMAGLRGMLPLTDLHEYRLHSSPVVGRASGQRAAGDEVGTPVRLIRPLLEVERADIEAYCQLYGLEPRFDRSNLDTSLFRNWLRHEVLPLMAQHNPSVRRVIRRSARLIADDYALLRSLLEGAWRDVVKEETTYRIRFDLQAWRALPVSLQRSTIREAIHRLRRSLRNISFVHVENALQVARDGPTGSQATLPRNLALRVGYRSLYVAHKDDFGPPPDWPLLSTGAEPARVRVPGDTPLVGSDWVLRVEESCLVNLPSEWETNQDPWRACIEPPCLGEKLWLRTRRPGDRFQPLGMGGSSVNLGNFLTNHKVPSSVRARLPLLATEKRIVWVCGQRLDERSKLGPDSTAALVLQLLRP
ncbi:tRNA lysidine(34) synthetase TilS [Chloroflexota bacterium]